MSEVYKRLAIICVLLIACGAAAFLVFAGRGRTVKPNVILIVIDTLRRDRIGAYGCNRPATPAMDALASENVLFTNAYANSNWTKPSIASLFTGLYVGQHGVKYVVTDQSGELPMTQRLPDDAVTLAEILKPAGYSTVGVVENVHISAKLGFAQGFEVWDESPYGAVNVTNAFLEKLPEMKPPFFAYVHYFDPHAPYYRTRTFESEGAITPGLHEAKSTDYRWTTYTFGVDRGIIGLSPVERDRLRDLYDGEIRSADTGLARIFMTLKARGMYDDSWIIVTADHGENFGESGRFTHAHDCFSNPQMRIPLIMKMPKSAAIGQAVVADAVELVDVLPTVVSYLALELPPGAVGIDIMPAVVEPNPLPPREVPAESEGGWMLVSGRYKYVTVPTEIGTFAFLYDESKDPLEAHNLVAREADVAARLAAAFGRVNEQAKLKETIRQATGVQLSPEEVERMRSVGYLHN